MGKIKVIPLVTSIAMCFVAGIVGSVFTFSEIPTWYAALNKPFFNPPNWIFGPVWTILYFLMGISFYLVWNTPKKKSVKKNAFITFFIQLLLNAVWSVVFFGLHLPIAAFIIVVGLWISIFLTIKYFLTISQPAARLLVPYLLWVSFASILNLSIIFLNR